MTTPAESLFKASQGNAPDDRNHPALCPETGYSIRVRGRVLLYSTLVATLLSTGAGPAEKPSKPESDRAAPHETFSADQKEHWAYQPITRPEPPSVQEKAWVRNIIDAFILADLETAGLKHAPEADRVALIRRTTFDLTGLPPTPLEVGTYLSDDRPDAYERLVDRLLASPRYGERWAQHWLDLAHYADTNGFEKDMDRPDAWRYRDWVVAALNADMPYDRFLMLQLAGDEIAPGDRDALIATGFARSGPREVVAGNVDPKIVRQNELTEVTTTVGSVFLGLTFGCARCHDHKFDALPTTDYYRLEAFFAASDYREPSIASDFEMKAYEAQKKAVDDQVAPLKKRMVEIEKPYRATIAAKKEKLLTPEELKIVKTPEKELDASQKKRREGIMKSALLITWEDVYAEVSKHPRDHAERERLKRAIYALESSLPAPPAHAHALVDEGPKKAEITHVLRRGEVNNVGPKVLPRPPGVVLARMTKDAFPDEIKPVGDKTGRRAALARWMVRSDNPLTARVLVNRVWQHHFGRGIVATPSDYGVRGEPPTHPELLDRLASDFMSNGWSLKRLHRMMMTSATYRQSSRLSDLGPEASKKAAADDPENSLYSHMNRRRLEAESLRDAMLAASGELNLKSGGPGVYAPIEKEVEELIFTEDEVVTLWPVPRDASECLRRSLYLYRKRNVRYPMFDAFDAPDTQTACARRTVSTHALQPLVLMNSAFAIDRARGLAARLTRESGGRLESQVERAYRVVLSRPPSAAERAEAMAFVTSQAEMFRSRARAGKPAPDVGVRVEGVDPAEAAAWVDFALAMLNRNEFVYIP